MFSKSRKTPLVAIVLLAALALPSTQCGILLHPERSGRSGGRIDIPVTILDCLWLLVGIIPGVVALIVDVATGGIYASGNGKTVHPGEEFALRFNGPAPVAADVAITLRGPRGEVSTLRERHFDKGERQNDADDVAIPRDLAPGRYELGVAVNGRKSAAWTLVVE